MAVSHLRISLAIEASESTLRLVTAMKADYSELLRLKLAVEAAFRDGKGTQKFVECVKSIPTSSFTAIFAKTFQDALTPEEIDDALRFFEGPSGENRLRYTVANQPAHRRAVEDKTDELIGTCQMQARSQAPAYLGVPGAMSYLVSRSEAPNPAFERTATSALRLLAVSSSLRSSAAALLER